MFLLTSGVAVSSTVAGASAADSPWKQRGRESEVRGWRWTLDSRVRLKQKDKTDKTKTVRRHTALAATILSDSKAQCSSSLRISRMHVRVCD